jgi:PDZ domain-containing protein
MVCPQGRSCRTIPSLPGMITMALLLVGGQFVQASPDRSPWEHTVVTVEVNHTVHDFLQPWSKRTEEHRKTGVVVGPRQILTTADHLWNRNLVRVQKGGRGQWWPGEVDWIDYHANVAVVSVADAAFWRDLHPVPLADPVPAQGIVEVSRWFDGALETRKGDINRVTVKRGHLTLVDYLQLEVTCEIKDPGWGEAVTAGKRLVGLVQYHEDNVLTVLPSSLIHRMLEAHRAGPCRGLGYFDFVWQRAQNPALHHLLGQTNELGALIIEDSSVEGAPSVVKPRDVILQVDGFDIDIEGDYLDPDYGKLMLENLSTRRHWAGDEIPLKIWRDGAIKDVRYRLPRADYTAELLPRAVYDQAPEYLVFGGLVFEPLTEPYLHSWGSDWVRHVPFRLAYYQQQKPTPERKSVVLLSMVLPDPFNLGYQDYRFLPVRRVNGKPISEFKDLVGALEHPRDGYHVIEFDPGDWVQQIVLDADTADAATRRVLERYGIQKTLNLSSTAKP